LALTSPTSGGRSVGIVRWRTETPEFLSNGTAQIEERAPNVVADVQYNRVKRYSLKYAIRYVANTRINIDIHNVIT
jgi:hypothetical protein